MLWVYNNKLSAWFHPAGLRSNNPANRPPSGGETAIMLADAAKLNEAPEYIPGSTMNAVEDCGCGGDGNGKRREK